MHGNKVHLIGVLYMHISITCLIVYLLIVRYPINMYHRIFNFNKIIWKLGPYLSSIIIVGLIYIVDQFLFLGLVINSLAS